MPKSGLVRSRSSVAPLPMKSRASLTRTDSVLTILFWMLLIQSIIGLVPALDVWRWPSAYVWAWIIVIAFCGTFSP